jgi:hypothetical protein
MVGSCLGSGFDLAKKYHTTLVCGTDGSCYPTFSSLIGETMSDCLNLYFDCSFFFVSLLVRLSYFISGTVTSKKNKSVPIPLFPFVLGVEKALKLRLFSYICHVT